MPMRMAGGGIQAGSQVIRKMRDQYFRIKDFREKTTTPDLLMRMSMPAPNIPLQVEQVLIEMPQFFDGIINIVFRRRMIESLNTLQEFVKFLIDCLETRISAIIREQILMKEVHDILQTMREIMDVGVRPISDAFWSMPLMNAKIIAMVAMPHGVKGDEFGIRMHSHHITALRWNAWVSRWMQAAPRMDARWGRVVPAWIVTGMMVMMRIVMVGLGLCGGAKSERGADGQSVRSESA